MMKVMGAMMGMPQWKVEIIVSNGSLMGHIIFGMAVAKWLGTFLHREDWILNNTIDIKKKVANV
jgi:hypothetical protein